MIKQEKQWLKMTYMMVWRQGVENRISAIEHSNLAGLSLHILAWGGGQGSDGIDT